MNKSIDSTFFPFFTLLRSKSNEETSKLVGRKGRLRQRDKFCIHDTIVSCLEFELRHSEAIMTYRRISQMLLRQPTLTNIIIPNDWR